MTQDFSSQNLQRYNFAGKDLSGAVFNGADIRGVNFTNANCRGANFQGAKAGVKPRTGVYLSILSLVFLISLGFISSASGAYVIAVKTSKLLADISQLYFVSAVGLILFALCAIAIAYKGLISGVSFVVSTILVGAVIAVVLARIEPLLPIAKVGSEIVSAALSEAAAASAIALAAATAQVVVTVAISEIVAVTIGVLGMTGALIIAASAAIAAEGVGAGVSSAIVIIAGALLSACLSWRALAGDNKQALILNVAISLTAWQGTNFSSADLTDADFTKATINCTNFQKALLTRTCWYYARKIYFALFGDVYLYLKDPEVINLLLTKRGENKNFDNQDFRGINLSGANLKNTSFIGTNFYQANLQGADLSGAKLVRTQFEQANLINSTLTGACIEDWVITRLTKLNEVVCEYVFMQFVNGDKRDQRPPFGEFGDGEFILFIRSILDTLELYHKQDINPRAAVVVLKSLANDYNESLEINGLQRTDNGAIILKLKISAWTDREELKEEYYSRYSQAVVNIAMQDPDNKLLLPQDDSRLITKLAEDVEELKKRPPNNIYIIDKLNIKGDVNIDNTGILQSIQNSTISGNTLLQGNNNQITTSQNLPQQEIQANVLSMQILEQIVASLDLSSDVKELIVRQIRQKCLPPTKSRNN